MLLEALLSTECNTPTELLGFIDANQELVIDAFKEQREAQKYADEHAKPFVYRKIFKDLAEQLKSFEGTQSIYSRGGVVVHTYLKRMHVPDEARVIMLDATGNVDIAKRLVKRNLKEIRVDVEKSKYATVTQVFNTGASKSRCENNPAYNDARLTYLNGRKNHGAVVLTKKAESDGSLWFGKCRGFNDYEKCRELHIGMGFNLPPSEIENLTRAVFANSETPIETGNSITAITVRGGTLKNYCYKDERMAAIDAYTSNAEIEQALHRARLVRRDKDNPVEVFLHTNKAVNITVDKLVKWQDLYDFKDGNAKRSDDAKLSFISLIREFLKRDGQLIWKRKNVLELGVTEDQWKRYKGLDWANHGLLVEQERYKSKNANNRNWSTRKVLKM